MILEKKIGIKKSSAQLIANYTCDSLIKRQILAVVNFPPRQVGKIISEVLVLGLSDNNHQPVLISPDSNIKNGKNYINYKGKYKSIFKPFVFDFKSLISPP